MGGRLSPSTGSPAPRRQVLPRTLFDCQCLECGRAIDDDGLWLICTACGKGWRRTLRGIVSAEEWIRSEDEA